MTRHDDGRRALGRYGEELVARRYRDQGYEVLARNWRTRSGEIDIVARKAGTVVVCEVKTRSSDAFGVPAEAVTSTKARRLRRLAVEFLSHNRQAASEIRFDVACVQSGKVEIIEAAF